MVCFVFLHASMWCNVEGEFQIHLSNAGLEFSRNITNKNILYLIDSITLRYHFELIGNDCLEVQLRVGDNCEQTPVIGDFFLLHFHMFTARQSIEVLNELLSQTATDSAAVAFLGDKSIMGTLCSVIRKGEGTCSASFDSWRVRVYATSMLIDFERPWFPLLSRLINIKVTQILICKL